MSPLVVSDIFGCTSSLMEIAQTLSSECEILDPYQGDSLAFDSEQTAYEYFMDNVGLEEYSEQLAEKISSSEGALTLVGFSVGASAIWNVSERFSSQQVAQAVGFYGSQIRKLMNLNPSFPLNLVMPKYEASFSIADVSKQLSRKDKVVIESTDFLHGFMNICSKNFDEGGYKEYMTYLSEFFIG